MHIWCSAFLCLAVSVGYTAAAISSFTSSDPAETGVTETIPLTGTYTIDTVTLTLAEDFGTRTITTFAAIVTTPNTGPVTWSSNKTPDINITNAGVVTANLDYETSPSMTATITYLDNAVTIGTIFLTLALEDVNDSPVFIPIAYDETVAGGSGAGTTVTTVTGSDADGAKTVTYDISAGNAEGVFEVVVNAAGNGEIKIATGKSVDRATLKAFSLHVLVKDAGTPGAGQNTGTATVAIGVCSSAVRAVATSLAVLLSVAIVILP